MCRNSWEFYLFAEETLGNPLYFQNEVKQNQVGDLEKSLDKQDKIKVRNEKKGESDLISYCLRYYNTDVSINTSSYRGFFYKTKAYPEFQGCCTVFFLLSPKAVCMSSKDGTEYKLGQMLPLLRDWGPRGLPREDQCAPAGCCWPRSFLGE